MERAPRIGVWLLGGRGSVATTALVGAAAVSAGAAPATGLPTAQDPALDERLVPLASLVFGGQDTSTEPLAKRAERLAAEGVVPARLLPVVDDVLARTDELVVAAPTEGDGRTAADVVAATGAALASFRSEHDLDHVVVVNVMSVEQAPAWDAPPQDVAELDAALAAGGRVGPAVAGAVAALRAGCAFVDFTPSAALTTPGVLALAAERGLPVAGRDGKTGETLLKSTLAPMLVERGMRVRSWAGTNVLGGGDGAALADPARAAAKLHSKGRSVDSLLPDLEAAPVHIDNVPDMGEWKTAWDHVRFEGFLGVPMTMQVTWQGCDSALAAPLVLDLVRLATLALQRGEVGPLGALAGYFKDPAGSDEHRFAEQVRTLRAWVLGQ